MRVLITGANGFIGRALQTALLQHGSLAGAGGADLAIDDILLLDNNFPEGGSFDASDRRLTYMRGDIRAPDMLRRIADWKPHSIFHLAAVLTSAAEADPVQALAVNVSAFADLIAALGDKAAPPRMVFPSSIAVFGGLLPDHVDDDHLQRPQTSYGTHNAVAELMLADATRHGLIDARVLRLPIVLVHPGPPTQSVSDRVACIVRDGVAGRSSICPLRPDTKVPVVSIDTAVRNMLTLHDIDPEKLRGKRMLNQPALTISMEDIVESIARVIDATPAVSYDVDPALKAILAGWPKGTVSTRAPALGIVADKTFEDIVKHYIRDARDARCVRVSRHRAQ